MASVMRTLRNCERTRTTVSYEAMASRRIHRRSLSSRSWRTLLLLALCMVASAGAQTPRDGEWPMATLDYANTRYSPLD